jgi:hypothetical protein
MGTDYDPPKEERKQEDDAATDRLLRKLETEMTKGR